MKKFKNRKEVEDFFKDEAFRFSFMSDNIAFFDSLEPKGIDNDYISFQLSFYHDGQDFFNYSKFTTWFNKFQIHKVTGVSETTNEHIELYFEKYLNVEDN